MRNFLPFHKAYLGYQSPVKNGSNSFLCFTIIENLQQFDFLLISQASKRGIKLSKNKCHIKIIDTLSEGILKEAWEIWESLVARTGWRRGQFNKTFFEKSWLELLDIPGTTIVGCFENKSECLIAWLIVKIIDDIAYIDTIASHASYLSLRPNHLLTYMFIISVRNNPNIKKIHYGLKSSSDSLQAFKKSFGFQERNIPVYSKFNPVFEIVAKNFFRKTYSRLTGAHEKRDEIL